jgi:hypothetical protein
MALFSQVYHPTRTSTIEKERNTTKASHPLVACLCARQHILFFDSDAWVSLAILKLKKLHGGSFLALYVCVCLCCQQSRWTHGEK